MRLAQQKEELVRGSSGSGIEEGADQYTGIEYRPSHVAVGDASPECPRRSSPLLLGSPRAFAAPAGCALACPQTASLAASMRGVVGWPGAPPPKGAPNPRTPARSQAPRAPAPLVPSQARSRRVWRCVTHGAHYGSVPTFRGSFSGRRPQYRPAARLRHGSFRQGAAPDAISSRDLRLALLHSNPRAPLERRRHPCPFRRTPIQVVAEPRSGRGLRNDRRSYPVCDHG